MFQINCQLLRSGKTSYWVIGSLYCVPPQGQLKTTCDEVTTFSSKDTEKLRGVIIFIAPVDSLEDGVVRLI